MSHKSPSFSHFNYRFGNFKESGCIFNHLICNACQVSDEIWNIPFRIYKCFKFSCDFLPIMKIDGNLGYFLQPCAASRSLNVNYSKHLENFTVIYFTNIVTNELCVVYSLYFCY